LRPPPHTTLFPYTTLFRSAVAPNGTVAPGERVRRLSHGDSFVDLVGYVQLSPSAPQAAFGGLVFDVIAPDGTDTAVTSNIVWSEDRKSTRLNSSHVAISYA